MNLLIVNRFIYSYSRLAPPPEPPALLLALEGDEGTSSPEDPGLVIDDRQTYDPELPTSPPPSPPPGLFILLLIVSPPLPSIEDHFVVD